MQKNIKIFTFKCKRKFCRECLIRFRCVKLKLNSTIQLNKKSNSLKKYLISSMFVLFRFVLNYGWLRSSFFNFLLTMSYRLSSFFNNAMDEL